MCKHALILLLLGLSMEASGEKIDEASPNPVTGVFQSSLTKLDKFRRELHQWDRVVRGFRLGHNFYTYIGRDSGKWTINGSIASKGEAALEHFDYVISTESEYLAFQYTYHLVISSSFGYYLGSSFGFTVNEVSPDQEIEVDRTLMLPGVNIGLVYNVSPAIRLWGGIDAQLLRYEKFREKHSYDQINEMVTYFNGRSFSSQLGVDFFFKLRWAIRAHYESVYIKNLKVHDADHSELGISRNRHSERYLFGLAYHII